MTFFAFPLKGRLDSTAAAVAQTQVEQALDAQPTRPSHVLLDLNEVTFLSSAGIRLLLVVHRRCVAAGGTLVLAGVGRYSQEVLQVAGLDDVFPRYANETEARQKLGA